MDSVELKENGNCTEDITSEQLLSLDSSDAYDAFGYPELLPRVGDQYQVEIPPLIIESDYLLHTKSPIDAENMAGVPWDFLMGLPVPVMWINKEAENLKHETVEIVCGSNDASNKKGSSEFDSVRETQFCLKNENSELKVEPFYYGIENRVLPNLSLEEKMRQYRGPGYYLVPGSCGDSWSDIEKATFLLGLYIFEKNFVQVARLFESKKMGDILSFYYGKFYRSDEYCRWSACRKMRSRRCAYGQRIFSGLRQQELLSRLLPHVSEECQNALLEVSRTFGEGKMPLEEYVSSLKATVGMNILVEAVGIGKGKQDLTGIAMEILKSNQVIHVRPEIPIGKAWSSLTHREIIKFLTGDYRLSKARSNDLFWEAVWPRLLARGWHSEQPKNWGYAAGSKHSLVFLIPGVNKFSRRLEKGNHYFDSVTDVLGRIASEPGLLELGTEEDEGNKSKEEYEWTDETKVEQDDLPERQRHCYLQPRTPNRNTDVMKFTVVDTSLSDGKTFKLRELRTLPLENSTNRSCLEGSDQDTSEVSTDDSDSAYTLPLNQQETKNNKPTRTISDRRMFPNSKNREIIALDQGNHFNGPDSTNVPVKNSKQHNDLCKDKQTTKAVKCQLIRRLNQDNLDHLAPVGKRRRTLSACSHAETSRSMIAFSLVPSLEQEMHSRCSDTPVLTENILSHVGSSRDKLSFTSSSKGNPTDSIERAPNGNSYGAEHLHEKPQSRALIDLNLPQVPPDFESGVFMTELAKGEHDHTSKESDEIFALKTSVGVVSLEQQPNANSRRHSTRNRPPTVRALEAFANGFLTTNRRQKSKEAGAHANLTSRPSRCVCSGVESNEFSTDNASVVKECDDGGNGVCNGGDSNMLDKFQVLVKECDDGGNGVCNGGNSNMLDKFQVLSRGNGTQVSGPISRRSVEFLTSVVKF